MPAPTDLGEVAGPDPDAPTLTPAEVYRLYFHGPAYQVVASGWRNDGGVAGRLADDLPSDRSETGVPTVLAPRLEELCFQVAGLWEAGHEGRLALPAHVDRLDLVRGADVHGTGAVAVARPVGRAGVFDCAVVDPEGRVVLTMEGYRTVPLPGPIADEVRMPLQRVTDG